MTDLPGWLQGFAADQRDPEEVRQWVSSTAEAIGEGVDLPADIRPLLLLAVEEHWLAFLSGVAVEDEVGVTLVPAAAELAMEVARHHLGLPVLLKIYQTAQEASWAFAVDVVRHAPDSLDHEALLVWFWTKANRWFGTSVELSVAVYQSEVDRIRRRGDARRFEVVSDVLAGAGVATSSLSAELGGHPINGVMHVAVIARAVDADAIEQLEPAITALAATVPGARVVLVRPGGRELWGWLPVSDGTRQMSWQAEFPERIRVTVGGPAGGIEGFVGAHLDARSAQRVALSPSRQVAVTHYDDVAALTLLALDPVAAERFVRTTLGGLDQQDLGSLRDTVRVVLTSTENADGVAGSLGVHKNTVRYRIQQAERLLGHPLRTRAGDLLLALDYYDAFLL
ncbi:helix-turn-helix domain-containing protein [Gordonia sp. ABSL11-1]|uniref:PucR family transcriptional regulator n=1 Tax=Gordonia sp. ABSL11-1 TaxID=3053924 RepID=UPI002572482C|nr:helix-turn-helix domain-containing protein [Gordonia sp. ABSL11-1]MDL9945617.1 helix-turn-helix domain-containing protein [Gordonia sp. ABSL11-1]